MKEHFQDINRNYDHIDRRQILNFKQLLKFRSLKNARKTDQESSFQPNNFLQDSVENKSLYTKGYGCSQFNLPLQAKSFQEINQKVQKCDSLSKKYRQMIFPLLKTDQEHKQSEYLNTKIYKSNKIPSRDDVFQRSREICVQKLKDVASNRQKRRQRYFKTRETELSLPSKLDCRSISPLTNYGGSSEKKFSTIEDGPYQHFKCRIASSLQKVSHRYQDIPISQFIYDNISMSGRLEKNMQNKMQKIWRKKSKVVKEMIFQS